MAYRLRQIGFVLIGLFLAGLFFFFAIQSFRTDWWMLLSWIPMVGFALAGILAIDAVLLMIHPPGYAPIEPYYVPRRDGAPNILFLVLPGYNADGKYLAETLEELTEFGAILTYRPHPFRFDAREIGDLLYDRIIQLRPDGIYADGESSLGGMLLVQMLGDHPDLYFDRLVLEATAYTGAQHKLHGLMQILRVTFGGPMQTALMRRLRRMDLRKAPTPETGQEIKAHASHQASLQLSASVLVDQIRFILDFLPPRHIAGRVGDVTYLRAPEDSDGQVYTRSAATYWQLFCKEQGIPFRDTPMEAWKGGLHAPTTERPTPVVNTLTHTIRL